MPAQLIRRAKSSWLGDVATTGWTTFQPGDFLVYVYQFVTTTPPAGALTGVTGFGATWTVVPGFSTGRVRIAIGTGMPNTVANNQMADATLPQVDSGATCWLFHVRGAQPVLSSVSTQRSSVLAGGTLATAAVTMDTSQLAILVWGNNEALAASASTPPGTPPWLIMTPTSDQAAAYTPTTNAETVQAVATRTTSGIITTSRLVLGVGLPPDAPTSLTADPGVDSAALAWHAPTTGGAVTGYDVRVDGGPVTADGPDLAAFLTGLEPLTTYTAEVRATGPTGVSAWVPVTFTTLEGADYRAVVRLGTHTWDVLAGDPPQLGPTLPLSFGWSIPEDSKGFPAQPDPDLCALELVTADGSAMSGVDIGTTMRVSIYPTNGSSVRPLATFRGRVADLEAAPHDLGLAWRLLGVGYTADPGTRPVGAGAWPQESGDARAGRIMGEAGYPGWSADPIGHTAEARNPADTNARAVLDELLEAAVSNDGGEYDPPRRVLLYPVTDTNGDLVPANPFRGAAVVRRVDALDFVSAGIINRNTSWRRTKLLDATWVRIDHPGGPTTYGDTRGPAYPAISVPILDPSELADLVLDTTPGYRWLTGHDLRLELWAEEDARAIVAQWFYRDPASPPFPWAGRAVVVEGIERTPDGSTRYAGMLAAAQLVLEHTPVGGRLVVNFRLRPEIPSASTVTMRWMDEPPTATWADELAADPTGTWYDYYTKPRP